MYELNRGSWGIRGSWHGAIGAVDPWKGKPEPMFRRIAIVCCPKCGQDISLAQHSVSEDGALSPSVVCPREVGLQDPTIAMCACGFHEHLKLLGWPEWKAELLERDVTYRNLGLA